MLKRFLAAALMFLTASPVFGGVLWQNNFDNFTKDYLCSTGAKVGTCTSGGIGNGDCSVCPGLPTGFSNFKADTFSINTVNPYPAKIVPEASYIQGENKRGYRITTRDRSPDPNYWGDNHLSFRLTNIPGKFFIRWYQKDSFTQPYHYWKIMRMWSGSTQMFIPEWYQQSGKMMFNVWNGSSASNTFWDIQLTSGWKCFEIMFDIPNKKVQIWVDGMDKGAKTISAINPLWRLTKIDLGGNHSYTGVSYPSTLLATRDYDEVVISDSYIGPIQLVPPQVTPVGESWYPAAKAWCDQNNWQIIPK